MLTLLNEKFKINFAGKKAGMHLTWAFTLPSNLVLAFERGGEQVGLADELTLCLYPVLEANASDCCCRGSAEWLCFQISRKWKLQLPKEQNKAPGLPHGVGHSSTCKEGGLALSHLYSSVISSCCCWIELLAEKEQGLLESSLQLKIVTWRTPITDNFVRNKDLTLSVAYLLAQTIWGSLCTCR